MSRESNGGAHVATEGPLVVVRVEDAIDPTLTAGDGAAYESPPQPREQAMALVHVLIGRAQPTNGADRWAAPIAGGRRVVTMTEEPGR